MNTNTKVLLTAVLATAALAFSPHAVRAEGMEGSHGMMMNDEGQETTGVAIQGFCPVCVVNGMKKMGNNNFTTEYKGKVYKFVGMDQQKMFINDPEKYVADLDAKFNALKDGAMMEEGSH